MRGAGATGCEPSRDEWYAVLFGFNWFARLFTFAWELLDMMKPTFLCALGAPSVRAARRAVRNERELATCLW